MSNSYVKQGFENGQVLKAEHLIKMEEGIINAQKNGGGGSPDWAINDPTDSAYIKNRTHYVEREEINITWDGNPEGLECIRSAADDDGETVSSIYYISDMVLSK